jgi:phytoene/squalene synthetase
MSRAAYVISLCIVRKYSPQENDILWRGDRSGGRGENAMIDQVAPVTKADHSTILVHLPRSRRSTLNEEAYLELAARITGAASKQAYYTIRYLVDRERRLAAYRAYGYFRWVDDWLDRPDSERGERLGFVCRQQAIAESAYHTADDREFKACNDWCDLVAEEHLLVDLVHSEDDFATGLHSYISNMMAVMAFDADRRDRLVTERELEQYTYHLSVAVTDALHYFIGHDYSPPESEDRYFPAIAAHITHMLRDTFEDIKLGYFNVPCELLTSAGLDPRAIESKPYREWVKGRVQLARSYFKEGSGYLDRVKSARCRLAGYAYMARFAGVLDTIEREEYHVRPAYPELSHPGYTLKAGSSVLLRTILRGKL